MRVFFVALAVVTIWSSTQAAFAADAPATAPGAISIPAPSIPAPPPQADAVLTQDPAMSLAEADKAYHDGNYGQAIVALDAARKGIQAKRKVSFQKLLPPAPGSQWQATDQTNDLLMSSVSRQYTANGQTVTISFSFDPNINKTLSSTNEMTKSILGAQNEEHIDIKGNDAVYKEMQFGQRLLAREFNINAGNVVVKVTSATIDKDTLEKFASIVDYTQLKAIK